MESRPPQESPRRPAGGRKPNGTGGPPTPPWLWLLLIAAFALIFFQFRPNSEVAVDYQPWFMEQAEAGNIKSLSIQGSEVHGELRKEQKYQPPSASAAQVKVTRFSTNFPSGESPRPLLDKVQEWAKAAKTEPQ